MEIVDKRNFDGIYCNYTCPYIDEKKYFGLFGHYLYCTLYKNKIHHGVADYNKDKNMAVYKNIRVFKCRHDGDNNAEMDSD